MSTLTARAAASQLWTSASLPPETLAHLDLPDSDPLPSSFHLGPLAQSTVGTCALAAAQLLALRTDAPPTNVSVSAADAAAEFRSEQFGTLDGKVGKVWDELVGVYATKDGWARPHTNWAHHKHGLLALLGLEDDATREEVAQAFKLVNASDFADLAMERGLVVTARRTFDEWDAHPHGQVSLARVGGPIVVTKVSPREPKPLPPLSSRRPLEGVKVLDLTRVIAGPTAGRTLAAYGADVLWVTSPHLPTLPSLDADTSRGKRTIQLDLRSSSPTDRATFTSLLATADVLLQSYRPGGLALLGFSEAEVRKINPDCIQASLSAWGLDGPWKDRKGFDSLVQFGTGIGEAEANAWEEAGGEAVESKPLPCQALDHASGYLLAFGIQAALYHRTITGGSYTVTNSLLDTATFLRSFGRADDVKAAFGRALETHKELEGRGGIEVMRGFEGKELKAVRHAARFEDAQVGGSGAPHGYADGVAEWL
ncbi:hypothetical protein RQP46_002671 [Phenoliferia psychrophenolica]